MLIGQRAESEGEVIRRRRKVRKLSWRWEIIDGAYQKLPDGRLVALNNKKGDAWYHSQTIKMARRQKGVCGICQSSRLMHGTGEWSTTFQHGDGRGLGGARRNDDVDALGNCAAHWKCNSELGSRRLPS